ncbi:MAG: type II toxin-antitoxin system PemK/MazF family toxin [Deltaproteobacteria bacterium]|nr:type II toxin-antitoxin system PemK/MazF family toxin [Deltaproteobacteria bacterium]
MILQPGLKNWGRVVKECPTPWRAKLWRKETVVFEGRESKAMADQLTTVGKIRLFKRAGILSEEDMSKIEEAVKIQLDIN